VAPEHKHRLVRALQAGGAVTAMTGDGVNDAPALRQADVGVAMGRAGTAVAREAADIVLVDDDFSTLRAAIEEGRRVYDNLVKALAFALPTNVGEGLIILIAVLAFPLDAGHPVLPIEPVQILWINLVATVALALPLALESAEPGVMRRPPRSASEPLLTRFVAFRTVYVGALMSSTAVVLFLLAAPLGVVDPASTAQAQTLAVTAVAFFQIFYVLNCRTFVAPVRSIGWRSNPSMYAGIATLLVLHAGFVHLPIAHTLFGTVHLTPTQWVLAAAAGALVVPAVAVEKWWRRSTTPTSTTRKPGSPGGTMDPLVIDLTGMRQVAVEDGQRTATVDGGATLRDVAAAAAPVDLPVRPGSRIYGAPSALPSPAARRRTWRRSIDGAIVLPLLRRPPRKARGTLWHAQGTVEIPYAVAVAGHRGRARAS
jgi:magnesium-transporting ATPase (P-type)